MLLDPDQIWDVALLALCVWREARGEPPIGQVGVGWTVKNRVLHPGWWGHSYPEVILHPWQYSSFNANDPNVAKLPQNPKQDPVWEECIQVASDVYNNAIADPTGGATHYYAVSMHTPPDWVQTAEFKIQLGNQMFYKAS